MKSYRGRRRVVSCRVGPSAVGSGAHGPGSSRERASHVRAALLVAGSASSRRRPDVVVRIDDARSRRCPVVNGHDTSEDDHRRVVTGERIGTRLLASISLTPPSAKRFRGVELNGVESGDAPLISEVPPQSLSRWCARWAWTRKRVRTDATVQIPGFPAVGSGNR